MTHTFGRPQSAMIWPCLQGQMKKKPRTPSGTWVSFRFEILQTWKPSNPSEILEDLLKPSGILRESVAF